MSLEPVPGLDFPQLTRWLEQALPDAGEPTGATLIAGGRSNLTYRLDLSGRSVALRRQPLGHVLPTAHDMSPEHTVLSALSAAGFSAPRPIRDRQRAVSGKRVDLGSRWIIEREKI